MKTSEASIGLLSDVGDAKQTNQDSVLSKYERVAKRDVGLFIVADGMGGLAYGEEVSNLIVTFFNHWFSEHLLPYVRGKKSFNSSDINKMLDNAITEVNNMALSFSKQVNQKLGSTLSLLLVIGDKYFIKNVGDSRIYIVRKNKKIQLTQDQSLVADMVRNKKITEAEARSHVKKNVLTMCIGVFNDVKVFSNQGKVKKGDVFLLCCDGFYNFASEENVVPIIRDSKVEGYNQKVALLRNLIPAGGAGDNVSIILVQLKKESRALKSIIVAVMILLTIGIVIYGFEYLRNDNYVKYLIELVKSIWK